MTVAGSGQVRTSMSTLHSPACKEEMSVEVANHPHREGPVSTGLVVGTGRVLGRSAHKQRVKCELIFGLDPSHV